ncbi:hypothetical protein J1N09_08650 [Aureitalea sp. L0-47]|uniref:hypothetical protein n=1 Tax=Aureitalea sp. L0-47 TaxID=2816962 RepID=UPI00223888AD|nr:hypothetical protein [Aureitalea sp. L0-47]MCW5519904.1 hypothetical protein [Aureitalea sp. L0-47]
MKVKILLLFIALTFLSGTGEMFSQRKNPRIDSGKNLYNTLATMLRQAKEAPAKDLQCEPSKLLRSIPRKKLLPTQADLMKEISRIVDDSLSIEDYVLKVSNQRALEYLTNTKTKTEYLKYLGPEYKGFKFKQSKFDRFYYAVRRAQKSGFKIFDSSFKQGECAISVETILKPIKFTVDPKRFPVANVDWEIKTNIAIECPCTTNNKFKVKIAKYSYSATCQGSLLFNEKYQSHPEAPVKIFVKYGLRFGKIKDPKLVLEYLECCKKLEDPVKKSSFTDPNEIINNNNTLLDTGVGIGFGKEVETNIGFSGVVLFNVTEIGGNPLFVGPKASVSTTSITSDAINELKILFGPTAEYQIPLNDGRTRIVTGVNSGYTFGNVESFGFDQNFSGITVNTYAGAQINVGNNLAITALLNFLEFSSLTFKSDMENFENTTSNTTFLTDGGAISVGVRIGLD